MKTRKTTPRTVEVHKARDGWRWRMRTLNGRIVAESGEAYKRRAFCLEMADLCCGTAPGSWIGYGTRGPCIQTIKD